MRQPILVHGKRLGRIVHHTQDYRAEKDEFPAIDVGDRAFVSGSGEEDRSTTLHGSQVICDPGQRSRTHLRVVLPIDIIVAVIG